MKAAVLERVGEPLAVLDVQIARPVGREVVVEVGASGLCHSDLHVMQSGYGVPTPALLGHEVAGVVTAVGAQVTSVRSGDHVVGCLVSHCGTCPRCISGRTYLCTNRSATARAGTVEPRLTLEGQPVFQAFDLGGFAEQILVHENNIVTVSAKIPFVSACLLGCAVVTGAGAVINTARVGIGDEVAVVGCGGVGLNAVQAARLSGAVRIIAIDTDTAKLDLARELGATHVVDALASDAVASVHELSGGVDHAFEAAGSPVAASNAFDMLRPGGRAYFIGMQPSGATLEFPANSFMTMQRSVQGVMMGSTNFKNDIPLLADYVLQDRFNVDRLVSHTIGLDDINEGYAALLRGGVARSVVMF